jgi:hypothetical protein
MATTIDDLRVTGGLTIKEDGISPQLRANILKQDDLKRFPVNFMNFRVWDAAQTNLPGTAAADDLALITGTWGTNPLRIQAGDLKAAGATTRRAIVEVPLPECYVAAETVQFIISAGMTTTVADTSCTVDLEVYKRDKIGGISADLCATAATTMNSLTFADKTFTITSTALSAGDVLDVRLSIACTDGATGTAVTPTIGGFDLVCDIRG